ncbi:hypothetical protein KORDIASMS9_02666 [Kordia sp. SMS9]|uniref:hypothetical protein n=1 Tax=Kordia sp. SMS9 TaxID=2282170 RepID=UPI000E0D8117|nr:hypothetical protein [Kordia sp. SMS9]AXG70426.1 hypothetical protein KORDIASMS9_02666 [Kordia sp. SMS9]
MKTVTVIDRQNVFDIALQVYGDARAARDIAKANQINETDDLTPGQKISLPESQYTNTDVLQFYNLKTVIPVTDTHIQIGVGYWSTEQYIIQ